MPRKVLAHGGHAGIAYALDPGAGKIGHQVGTIAEGAVSDHPAYPPIQVQYGCKAEIHAHATQLRRHQPTDVGRSAARVGGTAAAQLTETPRGRQPGKPVAEALHPTAFLIYGYQQVGIAKLVHSGG